eukprot:TRINITY_DN3334_c0_g1_i3.p1 TRINITY_DN3334_c0_g1~~TRINITY_DN3334_c0_g1_i3.p1  ORF type:complete len:298 (+),score=52.07 TRINITY_DN3334_c0_g1_i3:343-1236(+)
MRGFAEMGLMGNLGLSELRIRRNLCKLDGWESSFECLARHNMPFVVPIHEIAFGGKPADWNSNSVLTDFIFLRQEGKNELSSEVTTFVEKSKAAGRPIVVMGFSSMPISREKILEVSLNLIAKTEKEVHVIALVGDKQNDEIWDKDVAEQVASAKNEGKLCETSGAVYGKLFPEIDCAIIHGGLGATAEAIRAGVPTIVTGVLLMDQRFWGRKVFELGIGPEPVHINYFPDVSVELVDRALDEQCEWSKNAKALAKKIEPPEGAKDGVAINVKAVHDLSKSLKPLCLRAEYSVQYSF